MAKRQFELFERSVADWVVRFSNPPANLIDPETVLQFSELVNKIESSAELKVVVFESNDPDYFLGRYDVSRVSDTPTDLHASGLPTWTDMAVRLCLTSVVSIAKIRGRTRGAGSELALAMDLRFASQEKAIFGQPEVGAGLIPGGGALDRLPLLTGRARTLEIVLGCEDFDAGLAERYGWINRALPDAELDDFVETLAKRIASFDRVAIGEAKRLVNLRTLPDPQSLASVEEAFLWAASTWPSVQSRQIRIAEKSRNVGYREFEMNMGRHLGML